MRRFVRRHAKNLKKIHSNVKDFTYVTKARFSVAKKKMMPNEYSFVRNKKKKDIHNILKHHAKRNVHHTKRIKSKFKKFMRFIGSGIESNKRRIIPNQYSFWHMQRQKDLDKIVGGVKTFHLNHKNTFMLLTSIALAVFLLKSGYIDNIAPSLTKFGYLSVFVLGVLFPLGFTTALASAALYTIAPSFNTLLMALVASGGAMVGNLLIFLFVKYEMLNEVRHIFTNDLKLDFYKFEMTLTRKRLKSRTFRTLAPVFSGIFIALPIPTEMFVSILWNINKVDFRYMLLLSFTFSFIGFMCLGILHG